MATGFIKALVICLFCIPCEAVCQRQPSPDTSVEIVECEDSGCTPGGIGSPVWTLSGSMGLGHFGTGDQPLIIEQIDASSIAVRRTDETGPAKGLTALYMGRIDGRNIIGSVIYYDPNRSNSPRTGVWKGILRGSTDSLTTAITGLNPRYPFTLRECESNRCLQPGTAYPIVWTFPTHDGQGWLGDSPRPMTIEVLKPGFLLARRFDAPPLSGLIAYYFGEIKGRNIVGSVIYFDRNNPARPRSDTWFGEIQNSFVPAVAMNPPASNDSSTIPRDKALQPSSPSQEGQRSATNNQEAQSENQKYSKFLLENGCTRDTPSDEGSNAFDSFIRGRRMETEASNNGQVFEALELYCAAAKRGSAEAAFAIGDLYSNGFGVPGVPSQFGPHFDTVHPDVNRAFRWYSTAADAQLPEALMKVANYYALGPQIHWQSGSYSSISKTPFDVQKAVATLTESANLGDTEAMDNLIQVYTRGIHDETHTIAPDSARVIKYRAMRLTSLVSTQKECLKALPEIISRTPDRTLTGAFAGEAHGKNSFVCLVTLEPSNDDNPMDAAIGLLKGRPLASWIYFIYKESAISKPEVIKNSASGEYLRRLYDAARDAATGSNR